MSESPFDGSKDKLDLFKEAEKCLHLDSRLYLDVPWWDLIRYESYLKYIRDKKDGVTTEGVSRFFRLNKLRDLLAYSFDLVIGMLQLLLQLIRRKKSTVMIITHPRKVMNRGRLIDIYTDRVFTDIERITSVIKVEPRPYIEGFVRDPAALSVGAANFMAGVFSRICLKTGLLSRCANVDSSIQEFNLALRQEVLTPEDVQYAVVRFLILRTFYRILFSVIQPEHILLVISCGNEAIIAAAKDKNIKISELQHGSPVIGKLNYDYSNGISKTFFPDYFLAFGDFFCSSGIMPIPLDRCVTIGFPYLSDEKAHCSDVHENVDFLFITQPVIDAHIFGFVSEFIKTYPDSNVSVRLHPSTVNDVAKKYRMLKGVEVIAPDSESIYFSISRSRSIVGGYSTALFEATSFKKKIYSVPFGNYFLPESVCKASGILQVETCCELYESNSTVSSVEVFKNYSFDDLHLHLFGKRS